MLLILIVKIMLCIYVMHLCKNYEIKLLYNHADGSTQDRQF